MTERFKCVPLTSDNNHVSMIRDFVIDREAGVADIPDKIIGLESYLKRAAWQDDIDEQVKIYLIKDTKLNEIAAYFGLKAGMVVDNEEGEPSAEEKEEALREFNAKLVSSVLPGIEISHFAINDNYRRHISKPGQEIRGLGQYFYPAFIYPIIEEAASKIGVKMVYLFAANDEEDEEEKLIKYYERVFGFRLSGVDDFYMPLQPGYDGGCKFMYRMRYSSEG